MKLEEAERRRGKPGGWTLWVSFIYSGMSKFDLISLHSPNLITPGFVSLATVRTVLELGQHPGLESSSFIRCRRHFYFSCGQWLGIALVELTEVETPEDGLAENLSVQFLNSFRTWKQEA